ncbi:MAG: HlyC/CorC family transporter [Dehalococcoidia bacterium]|nr:HlyC/CorC family transporter [Dehalococcoidia bacterium]
MDTRLTVALLILCLLLSGFFAAAETAFFALQRVRIHHLVAIGRPGAKRVAKIKDNPEKLLATILLGNNLADTAFAALAAGLAISYVGDDSRGLGIAIATGLATIAGVVLGDATPKTIGARFPEAVVFLVLRPFELAEKLLFPVATLLRGASGLITFPLRRPGHPPSMSQEELHTMLRLGAAEGVVEPQQAEIITKTFRFGDLRGQDIMTPRTDIVWVPKDATLAQFLQIYRQETHTRFPVYDGDVDNVAGTLYVKDILKAMAEKQLGEQDPIAPLARPATFAPEYKPVGDLYREMRADGAQIAMLVDEYGGIAGLVSLKQIVGEIVGMEPDDHNDDEAEVTAVDDRTMHVDAAMRVDEVNERLRLGLPSGEYQTIAGFILAQLGHIPREGEQLRHNDVRIVIAEMRGPKIERVLVTRT